MADQFYGLNPVFKGLLLDLFADVQKAGGYLSVYSGYRSVSLQQFLYDQAIRIYGSATIPGHQVARPGNSKHNFGFAADLAGSLALAHKHARRNGLHFPVPGEAWHCEPINLKNLVPTTDASLGSVPTPDLQPLPTAPPTNISEDDMSSALCIEWPDGTKTKCKPDGAIITGGHPYFFGAILSLRPEQRQGFQVAEILEAINPKDPSKGYRVIANSGVYNFTPEFWAEQQKKVKA